MVHTVAANRTRLPPGWPRGSAFAILGGFRNLRLLLLGGVFLGAGDLSATARPGPGYGDLVDKYCIERGRLRTAAHQGHCAACHQQGTFDSVPQHRVEPNWTEFESGRASGVFDFFCPAPQAPAAAAAPAPQPPAGSGGIAPPAPPSPMGKPPDTSANPQSTQAPAPQAAPAGPTQATPGARTGTFELSGGLTALHDALRIRPPQEPAWRELVDAVAAATRRDPTAVATGTPTDRLKARERELSDRIVALRALDLALSRLTAQLDETQRRLLADGLVPLLDQMR